LETELLEEFSPDFLLDYFEIATYKTLGDLSTKQMIIELHLDEKNIIEEEVNTIDYESKGFLPSSRVQDFPIRAKAVYLVIRKRRWRHKTTKKEITNDYAFIAKGTKLTEDISDFF
jgi:hypothetical protein